MRVSDCSGLQWLEAAAEAGGRGPGVTMMAVHHSRRAFDRRAFDSAGAFLAAGESPPLSRGGRRAALSPGSLENQEVDVWQM